MGIQRDSQKTYGVILRDFRYGMKMARIIIAEIWKVNPQHRKWWMRAEIGVWGAPEEFQFNWTYIRQWKIGLEVS